MRNLHKKSLIVDFDNKLKAIIGKSFDNKEFQELIETSEISLKEKIIGKFKESRDERIKILGEKYAKEIEKRIFLQSIDLNWKSHIQYLEQLRQVIGLRSYGQRDPLIEYKKECSLLFDKFLSNVRRSVIYEILDIQII